MIAIADQSDMPVWGLRGWLICLLLVVLVWLAMLALRKAATPGPHPEQAGRAPLSGWAPSLCAVAQCEEEATVHVYASDEWWLFCITHGTPYLTENLRGGAA